MAGEVKPNVVKASSALSESSSNFVKISQNVDSMTGNFNDVLSKDNMSSATNDVLVVGDNIKNMTGQLNKTIPQLGCTINEINKVLCNIDEMTSGLNCTMRKPFGGLRLIFGSPVSNKKCKCE